MRLQCPKCSELAAIVDQAIQGTALCGKCGTRFFVNKDAAAAVRKPSPPQPAPAAMPTRPLTASPASAPLVATPVTAATNNPVPVVPAVGECAIFISYRRDDSRDFTGRIYDRLVERFGKSSIFKDVDSLPIGANFREHIRATLGQSKCLLAIVGPRWLDSPSPAGTPRIQDANDTVRMEIEEALRIGISVIPVLVDNASMPRGDRLPPSLQKMAVHQACSVRPDPDFHPDVDRLLEALHKLGLKKPSLLSRGFSFIPTVQNALQAGISGVWSRPAPLRPPPAQPNAPPSNRGAIIAAVASLALLLAIAGAYWVFWGRGEQTPSPVADATDAKADAAAKISAAVAALMEAEAQVWALEGRVLKEAEDVLTSGEAIALNEAPDTPEVIEAKLRDLLRKRRSPATKEAAVKFIDSLDAKTTAFLHATAAEMHIRPEELIVEWLTFDGALDLGLMTRIWQEQTSFRGEAKECVDSFLKDASDAPAVSKGVEVRVREPDRIEVSLFGGKVIESRLDDPPGRLEGDTVKFCWKSNYSYLREMLRGEAPDPVIHETCVLQEGLPKVDYEPFLREYCEGGHKQPWAGWMATLRATGVASRVRDEKLRSEIGYTPPPTAAARKPLHVMFAEFSPAVPVISAIDVSTGTGFLVKHDSRLLVVTNRHVVEPSPDGLSLKFISGRSGKETSHIVGPDETKVVGIHRTADLAVIEIDRAAASKLPATVKPLLLAELDQLPEPGEHLFAIGHPGAGDGILERTLTDGILSGRRADEDGIRTMQISVPINPGNSGGPLFNDDGRVVGVNTFIIRRSRERDITLEGLNFATEIGHVHELLDDASASLSSGEIARIVSPPQTNSTALDASQKEFVDRFAAMRQKALDGGFSAYAGDDENTHRYYELEANRKSRIRIDCLAREQYIVVACALGADDIDLDIVADDGTVIAKDEEADATPVIMFQVRSDGEFTLHVANPSDSDAHVLLGVFEK